jgi:phage tail sheath protein FI
VKGKGTTLIAPKAKFLMYYSLQMYFANGGGPCYIFSVGKYPSTGEVSLSPLKQGLAIVDAIKEPNLIIVPDAISLSQESDFYEVYNEAISKAKMKQKIHLLYWIPITEILQLFQTVLIPLITLGKC